MARWTLLLPMLLVAGCMGTAPQEAAESAQPAVDERPFAPPVELAAPTIQMGAATVGQPVRLTALAPGAAAPVDYVWRVVGPQGEVVLTGETISYTPLTPTEHAVTLDVHDAYDRSASARAAMPVALA